MDDCFVKLQDCNCAEFDFEFQDSIYWYCCWGNCSKLLIILSQENVKKKPFLRYAVPLLSVLTIFTCFSFSSLLFRATQMQHDANQDGLTVQTQHSSCVWAHLRTLSEAENETVCTNRDLIMLMTVMLYIHSCQWGTRPFSPGQWQQRCSP